MIMEAATENGNRSAMTEKRGRPPVFNPEMIDFVFEGDRRSYRSKVNDMYRLEALKHLGGDLR